MTTSRREENARRVVSAIRAGIPFDRIFPTRPRVEAPPDEPGWAEFVAVDGLENGRPCRSYILTCEHGVVELSMLDYTEDRDGEVLSRMMASLREVAAATLEGGCDCWPRGWRRVES